MALATFYGNTGTMTAGTYATNNFTWLTTGTTSAVTYNNAVDTSWIQYNDNVTTLRNVEYRVNLIAATSCSDTYTNYIQGPVQVRVYDGYAAVNYITTTGGYDVSVPKTAAEKLREILDKRVAPNVLSSCNPLGFTTDPREMRARETLRRVLGDDKFKDFIRRGHVTVRGKTGLVYQIFPGHGITKVYDRGRMTERLCVVLQGDFPPTDSLIMRYLMILNNEQQFRKYAITHSVTKPIIAAQSDQRSLVEIFKELKRAA